MRETICLFTSEYPFSCGETFLETEIQYLSTRFKKIYIFAFTSNTRDVRMVPKNVQYYSLGLTKFPFKIVRKLLSGFFKRTIKVDKRNIKDKIQCYYKLGTVNFAVSRIKKIIKKDNINIENCVFYSYWLSETALTACLLRNNYFTNKNIKIISRAHGSDLYDYAQPCGFVPLQYFSISQCDKIYAISADGKEYLSKKFANYSFKISISRLGTKNDNCWFNNSGKKVIVTCSNIIPLKRLDIFAKAFANCCDKNNDAFWVCFGDGPDLPKIQKILKGRIAEKRTIFMGRVSNEKVHAYYKNNPVFYFANVSKTEGIPVSIMEAMSYGIPCIATNVGGTSELVNQNNGFLLDKNIDSLTLCERLEEALKIKDSDYVNLRKNSRAQWETNYSAKKNYMEWCSILGGETL